MLVLPLNNMHSYTFLLIIFLKSFLFVNVSSSLSENDMNLRLSEVEEKFEKFECLHRSGHHSPARNCQEVKEKGNNITGIYEIQPEQGRDSFMVVCDMETRGGGWTYVLNRFNGSQEFHLAWDQYKYGFGNLLEEFWLGLQRLYELTGSEINELLVELEDWDSVKLYAHYGAFSLGSKKEGYPLKVLGEYSGDGGDSLKYHAGSRFSTYDRDQDQDGINCADNLSGGWWYKECRGSHLTGKYREIRGIKYPDVMSWDTFRAASYGLKEARMMVKPRTVDDPVELPKRKRKQERI